MINDVNKSLTMRPERDILTEVGHQTHAMAGATISLSIAHAVGLGQACVRISQGPEASAGRLELIQARLVELCDRDAAAIGSLSGGHHDSDTLALRQMLCDLPAEMCALALEAAGLLAVFRALVSERVHDDLEMSLALLAGAGRAALLLLDSNMRQWPDLLPRFTLRLSTFEVALEQIQPVRRIHDSW